MLMGMFPNTVKSIGSDKNHCKQGNHFFLRKGHTFLGLPSLVCPSIEDTRSTSYKKSSKNWSSLEYAFLYSRFLFSMMHFG